jgi:hypothetical protein
MFINTFSPQFSTKAAYMMEGIWKNILLDVRELGRLSDQLHRAMVLFMVRPLEYFSSPLLSEQFQDPLTLSPTGTVNTFNRP